MALTEQQYGTIKVRMNYKPQQTDFFIFALCEKQLKDTDAILTSITNETNLPSTLKKQKYVKKILSESSEHKNLPPGTYYAYLFMLYGSDPTGKGPRTIECMEQKILVRSGAVPQEITFSIVNELACLQIFTKFANQFIYGAEVTVEKQPNSYSSKGEKPIMVYLPKGTYMIKAHYKDMYASQEVQIEDLLPHEAVLHFSQAAEAPILELKNTIHFDRSVFGALKEHQNGNIRELSIRFTSDEPSVNKFIEETSRLMRLNISGVLCVQKMQRHDGIHYFQEEPFQHKSLREILDQNLPLNDRQFQHIATSIVEILRRCHKNGIVHRGLHAFNVLIGRKGEIKLCDFGIFTLLESSKQTDKELITLLSPEQLSERRSDSRTDIFFLSCLLFEFLTGQHVCISDQSHLNHDNQEISDALTLSRFSVSANIITWIKQGLSIDPNQRPQNLDSLAF